MNFTFTHFLLLILVAQLGLLVSHFQMLVI